MDEGKWRGLCLVWRGLGVVMLCGFRICSLCLGGRFCCR